MMYDEQIQDRLEFIRRYVESDRNPATLSKVDSNANITDKNSATLVNELFKGELIQRML